MPKSASTSKISRRTALAGLSASAALLAMPRLGRAADETIRIGFPTPLTGPFAAEARDQVKCAELAVKLANDKGGIGGRKVELLVRDDKLNAGEAATRTLELIEKDKVHAVVGALSSAVQLAVNEVTRARGVIYVSISQSDTINEVKDFSKYTFHEALNPHMTTAAVARQTLKKGMKVAHLVADYAYGHEMLRGFKRAQAAIGADSVGEILHPFGAADYSTFMPRLMSLRPDVLCISNFGRDQANAIKQAVDFGVKQQMKIVVPVILHNQRLAVGPDVFEGVVGGANYYWGLETQSKSAAAFNTAFKAANGGAIPTDYGAYGYAGVGSLLAAMQTAGGTDTDKVVDALEKLQYDLTKGPQHYRKCDHQSVQPVLVLESKKKSAMANDNDLFAILANDTGSDDMLRSCSELGHAT
ncbi:MULTISPECIES: ABC transporter substrate-binding protein [unclassified Bradyrhizobium]|uniref:ABC transporter substrate-binding protein n=1 Tax=unclassified Bradyrhizobium TaxID=2631580 RepID=UPI001FFB5B12|nr:MULTISPECIES: ABC transporter substrate-binding protein [unclassified Bradyrhizobium]MCK1303668.1 ABC transporter substrate-binding protein [Bradyrhizobium sp. 37]MCK1770743.1 ABC transporter substrate-binding protein [Bradyrhizobium sp. 134]